jgi:hypothetical protein
MIEAALPVHEAARLETLGGLGLLYTPAEERFDRVTRLACRLLDVPMSMVTLVDATCQWFKSRQGTGDMENARTPPTPPSTGPRPPAGTGSRPCSGSEQKARLDRHPSSLGEV